MILFVEPFSKNIFLFLGGYFRTIYDHEILARTSAVDLIVLGEGEESALKIVECIERGEEPRSTAIPSLAWMEDGKPVFTERAGRFDLCNKTLLNLGLLRYPRAYDILFCSFSRGCPYNCSFCMEEFIRPVRKEVSQDIVAADLRAPVKQGGTHNLLVSDALFRCFALFPLLRSLGVKVNFKTWCGVLPFFRLPADALTDSLLPQSCFMGTDRLITNVKRESLATFREKVPLPWEKYQKGMSGERKTRELRI